MPIGNCDCCERTNVPGFVVRVPGEPFACYVCQSDPDPDPYGEIEVDCSMCDGVGCRYCAGFGTQWVEARPVTLDDLDEIDSAQVMARVDATINAVKRSVEAA